MTQPQTQSHNSTSDLAQIWLIGGTSESAELAKGLSAQKLDYIVTVTTAAAARLYPASARIWVGKLLPATLPTFIAQQQIRCVLDASHPFASEISRLAIAQNLPYLRYERPSISAESFPNPPNSPTSQRSPSLITYTDSIDTLTSSPLINSLLRNQRVLFTLGYRHLIRFSHLRPSAKLFARILPSSEAIASAEAAGFDASELMALRPPVSLALEKALWQQWNISIVVAKASGTPGGEAVKRQAARSLGVKLILIRRPPMVYPQCTSTVSVALKFCAESLRLDGFA